MICGKSDVGQDPLVFSNRSHHGRLERAAETLCVAKRGRRSSRSSRSSLVAGTAFVYGATAPHGQRLTWPVSSRGSVSVLWYRLLLGYWRSDAAIESDEREEIVETRAVSISVPRLRTGRVAATKPMQPRSGRNSHGRPEEAEGRRRTNVLSRSSSTTSHAGRTVQSSVTAQVPVTYLAAETGAFAGELVRMTRREARGWGA
ncbi:hypothetical protein Purlil1_13663 [Purpureocillium lilacinum]|uniref:Uncharacterized protein n=1 Tax=Purpureocillium lilacinum TaxID=33203 RepID=A0ABR0BDG1_PURLI|nr:hypothetical protein Purlil1_13663 [Purpureocillium lilacinum]